MALFTVTTVAKVNAIYTLSGRIILFPFTAHRVTFISVSSSNPEDFGGDLSYKEEKFRRNADLDAPARTPNGRTSPQFEPVQSDGSVGADVEAANGDGPN